MNKREYPIPLIKAEIAESIRRRTHSATAFYLAVRYNKHLNKLEPSDLLELMSKTRSWLSEFTKANAYVKLLKQKDEY